MSVFDPMLRPFFNWLLRHILEHLLQVLDGAEKRKPDYTEIGSKDGAASPPPPPDDQPTSTD